MLKRDGKVYTQVVKNCSAFANAKFHINGIENFWGYAKHRKSQFLVLALSVKKVKLR